MEIIKEIGRKIIHLTSIFIVIFYHFFGKGTTLFILTALLLIFLIAEYIRVELNRKIPVFWRFFREREKKALGGEVYFLLGSMIAISVFPKLIAYSAILMTTFGDSTASLAGKAFGRIKIRQKKTLEGCIAEFLVNLGISFVILKHLPLAIVMAGVATIVETLTTKLDDNLFIPVFSGFAGVLVLRIMG
ncbi:MAG: CTP--2,3-di-O-geranylgeranyl-sn-glycero-1-phosphate cytidyltransferase [Candidatus Hydrothermarchaeota archaeon]|nr:MAG: CTP--2,3-di-O-geranylgeranyl-sn-glycero-1-phosphate cytidyltransferase [Candidatus Hydrothermarchaeota archaeon]